MPVARRRRREPANSQLFFSEQGRRIQVRGIVGVFTVSLPFKAESFVHYLLLV